MVCSSACSTGVGAFAVVVGTGAGALGVPGAVVFTALALDVPILEACPSGYTETGLAGSSPGTKVCDNNSLVKPATPGAAPLVGNVDKTKIPAISLNDLVKNGVMIAIGIAGLIFFFMLILGGLKYLNSGGDEKAVASARGTLTSAFIGLVIIVAAFLISQLLFTVFGLQGISVTK